MARSRSVPIPHLPKDNNARRLLFALIILQLRHIRQRWWAGYSLRLSGVIAADAGHIAHRRGCLLPAFCARASSIPYSPDCSPAFLAPGKDSPLWPAHMNAIALVVITLLIRKR